MRVNAWIALERSISISWWDYYQWLRSDRMGVEPDLDTFGKNALRKLIDLDFAFQCFEAATIQSKVWRMLSVYDVTDAQLNAGYSQYGDAETGGDYAVIGKWTWNAGDPVCLIDLQWNWRPTQVKEFMPGGDLWDVNLLAGQPPRVLPSEARIV